jgi:hypothetical protein
MAIQAHVAMKFGHLVTNPARASRPCSRASTRRCTTSRRPDGDGHRPRRLRRRYIGQQPVKVAEFERRLTMIKPFMNGEEVHWNDKDLQLKWVRPELPRSRMWVAGYGPEGLGSRAASATA